MLICSRQVQWSGTSRLVEGAWQCCLRARTTRSVWRKEDLLCAMNAWLKHWTLSMQRRALTIHQPAQEPKEQASFHQLAARKDRAESTETMFGVAERTSWKRIRWLNVAMHTTTSLGSWSNFWMMLVAVKSAWTNTQTTCQENAIAANQNLINNNQCWCMTSHEWEWMCNECLQKWKMQTT